ncbi:MAG: NCS2 family permease [Bacteriovoracia bacterium]
MAKSRAGAPSLKTEVVAGITTFLTMSYIVVVNPGILSTAGTGMPFSGVMTATVLICFLMTLMMGLYADLPFAVAPGMGINAYFTFTVILGQQVPWPIALGMVFWAGILFLLISVTPVRVTIARAIPHGLRHACAAGIGLFLTFIGLKSGGFIVADPVTFVKLGPWDHRTAFMILSFGVMIVLLRRKSPFAFLAGMVGVTVVSLILGYVKPPEQLVSAPDFSSVFFKFDALGALQWVLVPTIIVILFTDLFDSISTFIGVSQASGLLDEKGDPKNLKEGLVVDAFATLGAGIAGTSSGTAYIESSAGTEVGGRTGRTAVVTALCFLPCFFIGPIVQMVPAYATAPVLVLVGALMFRSVADLKLQKLEDAVPAFLTVILIPLTFSITQGILWGFISHVALYALAGRRKEVHSVMWGIAALSMLLLAIEYSR